MFMHWVIVGSVDDSGNEPDPVLLDRLDMSTLIAMFFAPVTEVIEPATRI